MVFPNTEFEFRRIAKTVRPEPIPDSFISTYRFPGSSWKAAVGEILPKGMRYIFRRRSGGVPVLYCHGRDGMATCMGDCHVSPPSASSTGHPQAPCSLGRTWRRATIPLCSTGPPPLMLYYFHGGAIHKGKVFPAIRADHQPTAVPPATLGPAPFPSAPAPHLRVLPGSPQVL